MKYLAMILDLTSASDGAQGLSNSSPMHFILCCLLDYNSRCPNCLLQCTSFCAAFLTTTHAVPTVFNSFSVEPFQVFLTSAFPSLPHFSLSKSSSLQPFHLPHFSLSIFLTSAFPSSSLQPFQVFLTSAFPSLPHFSLSIFLTSAFPSLPHFSLSKSSSLQPFQVFLTSAFPSSSLQLFHLPHFSLSKSSSLQPFQVFLTSAFPSLPHFSLSKFSHLSLSIFLTSAFPGFLT